MGSVAHYLEVNAPADQCYAWWRGLTNLPADHAGRGVGDAQGGQHRRHALEGLRPLGKTVQWDAKIVEDVPGTRIAWATEDSSGLEVKNAGAVRFDDHGGTTGVEVSLQYDPPAGFIGEAVAKIFSDPQSKVEKALEAFKTTIEASTPGSGGTTVKQT
jgi:uncharacterized membrane protein